MNSTVIYLLCGVAVLGLLIYLYIDGQKTQRANQQSQLKSQQKPPTAAIKQPYEPLRQMGLVQADEFESYYLPVIEKINQYEKLINLPANDSTYFELLLTGLRQRRSVIFDIHSPEVNSTNRPFWTLALFVAMLCRYTVRLLNSVEFRDQSKNTIIPFLESPQSLYATEKKRRSKTLHYEPDCIYVNIIEKIVPANVIVMLANRGVYPFLVNAVTGCYQQRQLPFYTLIETVENHVLNINQTDTSAFKKTIDLVLKLIENNTITKNTDKALVYESTKHLYIDRHLFWELFKTYSVFEQRLISKRVFEQRLIEVYALPITTLEYDRIHITLSVPGDKGIVMDTFIEITNLVGLPYSTIPDYVPHQTIRTKRVSIKREIQYIERDEQFGLEKQPHEGDEEEEVQNRPTKRELKDRRIAKQKQLFTPSEEH